MNLTTQATMSSLEMVDFINSTREEGQSELRHDHFMVKVPSVLGEKAAPKFLGTAFYEVNGAKRERAIYNFPKREAMLMAMSYSTKLQAKVYDHMEKLESQLKALSAPISEAAKEASALLGLAETIANNFRMCESTKLELSHRMLQKHTPAMVEYLPRYAINTSPSDIAQVSSLVSHSLRELLDAHCRDGTDLYWNIKFAKAGLLAQVRTIDNDYWSITEKGLEYGKNLVNEKSPNETQPYWYDATFLKLIELVK